MCLEWRLQNITERERMRRARVTILGNSAEPSALFTRLLGSSESSRVLSTANTVSAYKSPTYKMLLAGLQPVVISM